MKFFQLVVIGTIASLFISQSLTHAQGEISFPAKNGTLHTIHLDPADYGKTIVLEYEYGGKVSEFVNLQVISPISLTIRADGHQDLYSVNKKTKNLTALKKSGPAFPLKFQIGKNGRNEVNLTASGGFDGDATPAPGGGGGNSGGLVYLGYDWAPIFGAEFPESMLASTVNQLKTIFQAFYGRNDIPFIYNTLLEDAQNNPSEPEPDPGNPQEPVEPIPGAANTTLFLNKEACRSDARYRLRLFLIPKEAISLTTFPNGVDIQVQLKAIKTDKAEANATIKPDAESGVVKGQTIALIESVAYGGEKMARVSWKNGKPNKTITLDIKKHIFRHGRVYSLASIKKAQDGKRAPLELRSSNQVRAICPLFASRRQNFNGYR